MTNIATVQRSTSVFGQNQKPFVAQVPAEIDIGVAQSKSDFYQKIKETKPASQFVIYGTAPGKEGTYKFKNGEKATVAEIVAYAKSCGVIGADGIVVIYDGKIDNPQGSMGTAISQAAKEAGVKIAVSAGSLKNPGDKGVYIFDMDGSVRREPCSRITETYVDVHPIDRSPVIRDRRYEEGIRVNDKRAENGSYCKPVDQ
jgi:hypothetical protein